MNRKERIKEIQKIIASNNSVIEQARINEDRNAMQLTADLDKESILLERVISDMQILDKINDKCKEELRTNKNKYEETSEDLKLYRKAKINLSQEILDLIKEK